MPRKPRFPPEPDTRPDARGPRSPSRRSGPAPKDAREKSEAPTLPPPGKATPTPRPSARPRRAEPPGRPSGVQKAKPDTSKHIVDEVTADMSKDPRRERDDEDD